MFRKSFSLLVVMGACAVAALASMDWSARAEPPETVSVTFALVIPVGGPADLSDFLGEDTLGIVFGNGAEVADNLLFSGASQACDGVDVAGTQWSLSYASVKIVDKGGVIGASVYSLPGTLIPPEQSFLFVTQITAVHGCWLKEDAFGKALVQDAFDTDTLAAFFIVTAEFRVKN